MSGAKVGTNQNAAPASGGESQGDREPASANPSLTGENKE